MNSRDFKADMEGFDFKHMRKVVGFVLDRVVEIAQEIWRQDGPNLNYAVDAGAFNVNRQLYAQVYTRGNSTWFVRR